VDPKNVHAYVLGEHGESEFVPWSQATVGTKRAVDICKSNPKRFPPEILYDAEAQTRNAAHRIIAAKGATCYGIATALCRLTDAILSDERSIFTVSCLVNGAFGIQNVYIGMPAILGKDGVREILLPDLTDKEADKLLRSANYLDNAFLQNAPRFV
jgi:L-lactate dehydrogenase